MPMARPFCLNCEHFYNRRKLEIIGFGQGRPSFFWGEGDKIEHKARRNIPPQNFYPRGKICLGR